MNYDSPRHVEQPLTIGEGRSCYSWNATKRTTAMAAVPVQRHVLSQPYSWPFDGDLRPENTCLLAIDMQTDFCGKGGYVDNMGYVSRLKDAIWIDQSIRENTQANRLSTILAVKVISFLLKLRTSISAGFSCCQTSKDISMTRAPIIPLQAIFASFRKQGYHIIHTREGHLVAFWSQKLASRCLPRVWCVCCQVGFVATRVTRTQGILGRLPHEQTLALATDWCGNWRSRALWPCAGAFDSTGWSRPKTFCHTRQNKGKLNGLMDEKMIGLLGSPGDFWAHDIHGSFKRFTIKRVTLFPEHLSWWECLSWLWLKVRGEPGWNLIPELQPTEQEDVTSFFYFWKTSILTVEWMKFGLHDGYPVQEIIDKPGKGSFVATDLDLILKQRQIKNLIFTGITTDVCVGTTMREANDLGCQALEPAMFYMSFTSIMWGTWHRSMMEFNKRFSWVLLFSLKKLWTETRDRVQSWSAKATSACCYPIARPPQIMAIIWLPWRPHNKLEVRRPCSNERQHGVSYGFLGLDPLVSFSKVWLDVLQQPLTCLKLLVKRRQMASFVV